MKNLIPFLLILVFASCKKDEFDPNLTREFSIHSVSNGADYPVKVALPENYNTSKKYATLYVLDGDENFDYVSNNCQEISADYNASNCIVVAIGYGNDRSYDYTPTKADHNGGGAEAFMHFINDELIPKMQNDFGADTSRDSRVILGHSFGGLFAAYAFTKYNDVFGYYLMLSPSLWYDNEITIRYEQENRQKNSVATQRVFMGLGSMESDGRMLAPFEAFYQRLQNNYTSMKIVKHIEPHLDHMASKNPNILEGLKFYFQNK